MPIAQPAEDVPTLDTLPEFLTPWEYKRVMRFSLTKVYDGLRKGEIPSTKVGGQYRIPKSCLVNSLTAGAAFAGTK